MKKIILILIILTFNCGLWDRITAGVTGGSSDVCMNGVLYYQFTSGSAVAYNTDGTVKLCKEK